MSMRKIALTAAALLAASTLGGVGISGAQAKDGLPFITGGGHNENNNSGNGVEMTTFGGFNAQATEDMTDGAYPARGEVQGRTAGPDGTVAKVHGDVVCIANLGPADADSGGAEGVDVWEIRFQVEKSDPELPAPYYASLLVQDNGQDDYADENFDPSAATDPSCGDVTEYQLEPHQGQIKVHA
jgi:hypothetical protein